MRSLGARLAIAAGVLAIPVDAWATPVSGSMTRGASDTEVLVQLKNDGSQPDIGLDIDFPSGTTVTSASFVSGGGSSVPRAAQGGLDGSCGPTEQKPERVVCNFGLPDGWPAGSTITVKVGTSLRLPDDAKAQAYSCGIPCEVNNKSGPYIVGFGAGGADLTMFLQPLRIVDSKVPFRFSTDRMSELQLLFTVGNEGPVDAEDVDVDVRASTVPLETTALLDGVTGPPRKCDPLAPFSQVGLRRCTYAAFAKDRHADGYYTLFLKQRGQVRLSADVTSRTPDPNPANNGDDFDAQVTAPGGLGTRGLRIAGGRVISGRAALARITYIAVAEEEGGANLTEVPGGRPRSSASARCRWLTSKRVRFRTERGRKCDQPSYIRVKVRKGRWKLPLRKRLPAGRYVVMSRAVSPQGLIESGISPKLGNLKRFRVR